MAATGRWPARWLRPAGPAAVAITVILTPTLVLVLALVAVLALAGCGPAGSAGAASSATPVDAGVGPGPDPRTAGADPSGTAGPTDPTGAANPAAAVSAPTKPFAVGTRQLTLHRGPDRPLRTVVWYPARGTAGTAVRANAAAAAGRFPLIVFSHGLTSSPEAMSGVITKLVAAGFVVAAPAYPHTSNGVASFDASDMANQPADASVVITEVLKLDTRSGDLLAGHLDPARVGAGGHSAGGFTTAGLLSGDARDRRVRAGVIISGGAMGGPFAGAATPVLFIHGDADAVVKYAVGRSAYDRLGWPKAFLTIVGGDHVSPVGNATSVRTMIDFLRWTLYTDAAAKARLPGDATVAGKTRYESSL